MFRFTDMQSKVYGIEIEDVESDADNIQDLVDSGNVVIICESLEDAEIYYKGLEIEIVEAD